MKNITKTIIKGGLLLSYFDVQKMYDWKEGFNLSIKITNTEKKETPAKKIITLKNISAKDLKLIDTETGEDITQKFLAELPDDIDTVAFKISVDMPDELIGSDRE